MGCNYKLWIIIIFVRKSLDALLPEVIERFALSLFIFPDFWQLDAFRSFIIDHAPYVSTRPLGLTITLNLPKWILIEPASIAIWNKNKIIIVLTIGIWVVYLGFIVAGGSSSSPLQTNGSHLQMWFRISYLAGENWTQISFDLFCSTVRSSALHGQISFPSQAAACPTWNITKLPSLSCSPLILLWFPSCFLVCSVCVVVAEACLAWDASSGSR
jgi:hypothetical protein